MVINKKKYHFGYVLFFFIQLVILLVGLSGTSCYASTNVTREYLEWSFDYLYNNGSFGTYDTRFKTALNAFKSNSQNITNVLNQLSTLQTSFNIEELGNYNLTIHTDVWSGANNIWFTFFNASSPGSTNIAHLSIKSTNTVQPKTNATTIGGKLYHMKMSLTNAGVPTFSQLEEVTSAGTYGSFGTMNWNSELTVLTVQNMTFAGVPFGYAYYPVNGSSPYPAIFQSIGGNYIVEEPEPEEPSGDSTSSTTGTITNNSGDTTGKIDLSGIEQGIGNIQNQISGDTQKVIENQNQNTQTIINTISGEVSKITNTLTNQPNLNDITISSGDIESSLGFDFMADPYANFWYELTNGLRGSLTGSVRQIPVDWLGYQGVFDLDKLGFNYPSSVRLILTSVSTVSMVWILVKWWKIIVDKLTSGNMDEVLAMNEEERYY